MKYLSLWICLICIGLFIFEVYFPVFVNTFMLTDQAFIKPWQFFTAIFLHATLLHLLYNLFALFLFGLILEKLIGSKRFLLLFIFSGLFANFLSFFWYPNSLGASGAIMAIIGTIAVLRPMMATIGFGMILPMFALAIIWVIGSIMGIFGFGDQTTGHLAHLSGILIGILYGFYLRFRAKNNLFNTTIYKSKMKVIIPEDTLRRWEDYYIKK